MRTKKTPKSKRGTYKQYDENGKVLYEFDPETDTTMTELTIEDKRKRTANMHKIDDSEVYFNLKYINVDKEERKARKKQREEYILDFKARFGYEPNEEDIPINMHREYVPIDSVTSDDEELGDASKVQEALSVHPFEEDYSAVQCMRRLVEGFTKREQEVYYLVGKKGLTKRAAAKKLEISEMRVGQIMANIIKKLRSNPDLRRFFRDIDPQYI